MKRKLLLMKLCSLLVGLGLFSTAFATELSGIYTINPTGAATASNFQDFGSAITYLTSSGTRADAGPSNVAPFGVSGPVTFMVSAGTYSGQVIVPVISGTSNVNTVTFEGVNPSTRIITATIAGQATVVVNQAKYVVFRNLTITNNGVNNPTGIAIVGTNTNNAGTGCKILKCIVNVPNTNISNTSYGILTTATALGAGASNNRIDSVEIDSNTVNGGYYGIYFYGNTAASAAFNRANKLRNNVIESYYMGIYTYYHYNQFDLLYNTVNMYPTSNLNYGIYFYYCQNSTAVPSNIIGNKIYNASYMGMYIANSNNGTANATKVYNNVIAGTFLYSTNYGLYTVTTHKLDVQHNSADIGLGSTGGTKYAFYFGGATAGNTFKNNNFSISATSGTTTIPAYFSTNPTGNVVNYNNYSNAAGINLGYRGANFTNVVTSYKTATTGGDSSFNIKPAYTGLTDLHLKSACLQPMGVDLTATVPTDIDGLPRTSTPYVGAYEPVLVSNDLAVDAYLYPLAPITLGLNDLAVRVRNNGTTIITSFNVSYKLGSGAAVTLPWTGSLNPCDTATMVFTGANQITLGALNSLKVYTSSPNALADGNAANDTFATTLYAPLNGAYTVGPTGNFTTLAAAATALSAGGLTGPVVFTVAPGTYTDRVILNGPLIGGSSTNTVTFDGVDAATRIVETSFGGASILINQASYVTIKNLTVKNTFAGLCSGIALVGNTTNNAGVGFTVKNCNVQIPNSGTGTSYGIIVTGNATGTGDANQFTDSVTIDSNTIIGGYYGIQISTSGTGNASYNRGHRVRYNTINNAYYYGMRIYYLYNAVDIIGNKITMNPINVSSYGIYFYYCQNSSTTVPSRVIGNDITAGYTALYNYYTNTVAVMPTQIWNNKLIVNGSCYAALYCANAAAATVSILHNTVVALSTGTYGGMYFATMTAAGTIVKNNIFSNNGGTAAYYASVVPGNFTNYNNYYNAGGPNLVYRGGVNYTSATYKTATAGGDSSFNVNPSFMGGGNYNLANGCDPKGVDFTSLIPLDIDGNTRSVTPLAGASEYIAVANDIMIEKIVTPVAPVTSGLQDVVLRVKNTGNNLVTSFNISYKNNAGATVTQPWSGFLNACDTVSITFTGADQINILPANNFMAYTSMPNGLADAKSTNDTVKATYLSPLNGSYTIGTSGTYTSFAAANEALLIAGMSGPVTFNVLPGTYNEQVVLSGNISGLSSTNTITYDGGNAATRIVKDSASRAAFIINKKSYITIKNLTVTNTFPGVCSGIALIGSTANNEGVSSAVKNCIVNLPNTGTSTSYGIIVTGNTNGTGDANQWMDSVTIDSNTTNGGYYGIQISTSGNSNASYNRAHRIRYNTVNNAYYYGIRAYYLYNSMDILNNTIVMNPSNVSSYGIYFYYCQNASTTVPSRVNGNNVTAGYAGLYNYYTNSGTTMPTQIHNNIFVTNGSCYSSLYCANPAGATVSICHNTVVATNPGTYGMYFGTMTATGSIVKNNVFAINGGTPAYYAASPTGNFTNYNNYINKGGAALVYRSATTFTSTNYNTATAGGDSSFNQDPLFVSATDFHSNNGCTKGVDLTAIIPTDYDGNIRSTAPSLGAFETVGLANDITVDKVYISAPVLSGLQDVSVRIRNASPNTATSFNISYKLNGGAAVSIPWTGTMLGCGDTAYVTFTGAQQMNLPAGSNSLLVYTSAPNGLADNNRNNDTATLALTTITKISGNALIMNGTPGITAGSSIRFASRPEMIGNSSTEFTAEAWVKITSPTSDQKFASKSNVSNGFCLGVNPTGRFDPEIWTVANGTGSVRITTAGVSLPNNIIPANTWTHVAVTWKSGVGVKAYINGSLAGYLNSATTTTISQSAADLFLGTNSWDYGFATTGAIDEVRLWNVALDSITLRRNMHRTLSGTEPGLTTYIQLNEGTSSTLFGDAVGGATGYRNAAAIIAPATMPLGGDSSLTMTGVTSGTFYNGDMTLNIGDPFDNACDLTLTEINNAPNVQPVATTVYPFKYWVVRPFGTPGSFLADMTLTFPLGQLNITDPALRLYKRDYNADGAWTFYRASTSIAATSVTFTSIDTFGQFTVASNGTSPLPVSLLSFNGKRNDAVVNLNWLTANEINSRGFEVQRTYDVASEFETIAEVKSIGNNKGTKSAYNYTDKEADLNQTIYYRLKQVDMDGKYSYSPVVVITAEVGTENTTVYPNPFTSEFSVRVHSGAEAQAVVRVVDITGKEMYSKSHTVQSGSTNITIDGTALKTGLYFVTIELNGEKQTVKLNKQ